MGNCYSMDHIAEDHIHTDITCNREEPQQKYCLGIIFTAISQKFQFVQSFCTTDLKMCTHFTEGVNEGILEGYIYI